jgi:Glycosyl transferase family 2
MVNGRCTQSLATDGELPFLPLSNPLPHFLRKVGQPEMVELSGRWKRLSMKIFIIIPAYNEIRTIRSVTETLLQQYAHVVVVDDGSSDGTSHELEGLPIHQLRHVLNRGQ